MSDETEWTGILQPDETVSVQRSSFEGSCPVHLDRTSVWFSSKDDVFNKIINCTVSDDAHIYFFPAFVPCLVWDDRKQPIAGKKL